MRASFFRFALVCLVLALCTGDLWAGPCDRGGRRGPVRALLGAFADRAHERREARTGGTGASCTTATSFAPAPGSRPVSPARFTAPSCPNGRCPLPR